MRCRLLAATLLLMVSTPLAGQPWTPNGDGTYTYHMTYSTSALFVCNTWSSYLGTCLANDNSITFGNQGGTGSMTLTFEGTTGALDITGDDTRAYIGRLTKSYSGAEPFQFAPTRGEEWVFGMRMFVSSTDPVTTQGFRQYHYYFPRNGPINGNCCEGNNAPFARLGFATRPPNLHVQALIFHDFDNPIITTTPEALAISATVTFVPEPSTYALMGAGLLLIGVFARSRQR